MTLFSWFQLLQPYTRANWTNSLPDSGGMRGPYQPQPPGIHVCPDYARLGGWFFVGAGGVGLVPSYGSYGYNTRGYAYMGSLGLGWENFLDPIFQPVREGEVVCPSDMIAISDALLHFWILPVSGCDDLRPEGTWPFFIQELGLKMPPGGPFTDYQTMRHGGRWNVLYCDGHVLGESTKQFLDSRSDAVLRSWSREHAPRVDGWIAQVPVVRGIRAGACRPQRARPENPDPESLSPPLSKNGQSDKGCDKGCDEALISATFGDRPLGAVACPQVRGTSAAARQNETPTSLMAVFRSSDCERTPPPCTRRVSATR